MGSAIMGSREEVISTSGLYGPEEHLLKAMKPQLALSIVNSGPKLYLCGNQLNNSPLRKTDRILPKCFLPMKGITVNLELSETI
jgi:hypothetical protein